MPVERVLNVKPDPLFSSYQEPAAFYALRAVLNQPLGLDFKLRFLIGHLFYAGHFRFAFRDLAVGICKRVS